MKTASTSYPVAVPWTRLSDYVELTKPRISVLVLFTVGIGALLATHDIADLPVLVNAIIGTALIASAASALNQLWERNTDALMRRTESRPLPSGRLMPLEVLVFGIGLAVIGLCYLAFTVRQPWCGIIAAGTFLSYVFIYTPLKRYTTANTLIGAVPGALPPVIGWTAIGAPPDLWIVVLFLVLLFWQLPHFLAIAWMYRDDYGRAGLRMLPVMDTTGDLTAGRMLLFWLALAMSSFLPVFAGIAGWSYAIIVGMLAALFLASIIGFARDASHAKARRVLHVSLFYLPAVCVVILLENLL